MKIIGIFSDNSITNTFAFQKFIDENKGATNILKAEKLGKYRYKVDIEEEEGFYTYEFLACNADLRGIRFDEVRYVGSNEYMFSMLKQYAKYKCEWLNPQ